MVNDLHKDTGAWDLVAHYLQPVKHLFHIEGVTEICVNRYDEIFIEKFGKMTRVGDVRFPDETYMVTLVNQIANALGQTVHKASHPVLDARLMDGTRVCAVLHPVATKGTCITFRIFPKKKITAEKLINNGSLTRDMLEYLTIAVFCRCNILISGGTGSGKTTLLNVLSSCIPRQDRILTVEDTRELQIESDNHVALEAPLRRKQKDSQDISLAFLIKTTLRKKPTRIIVGEIRDANAATAFLQAINTGHSACSTIHANNPEDALNRIQSLVAGSGDLPFSVVESQVRSNLNILVHAENTPNQGRRITDICELVDNQIEPLFNWSYKNAAHVKLKNESTVYDRLEKFGMDLPN